MLGILASCASNMSKNLIQKGEIVLRDGIYQGKPFEKNLKFDRVSWYQELTLMFDFIYAEVPKDSPFYQWFSIGEKAAIEDCDQFLVGMTYYLDSKKISSLSFKSQLRTYGVKEIDYKTFYSFINLHPDFERLSLKLYRPIGVCTKNSKISVADMVISFPGYSNTRL